MLEYSTFWNIMVKPHLRPVAHVGYIVQAACSQLYMYNVSMYWLYRHFVAFFTAHNREVHSLMTDAI